MTTGEQLHAPNVRGTLVARNALLNFVALGVPLLVAFVALPVLIAGLGAERFGVLAIAWMILTYLSELGFGATTLRFAAEALGVGRRDDLGAIAWTTAGLQAAVGLVEGMALAAVTPWLVSSVLNVPTALALEARTCLYFLSASIPLLGIAKSFRGLVEAAQRFDLALAVHLPVTTGAYVLAAIGASLGWTLPAIFGVILLSRLVSVPAYFLVARRALPNVSLRPAVNLGRLRELTTFAGWVAVSTIVSPLLVNLDRFMVGALLSMTAVTFYAAPYELVARLALVPAGIVGALYPAFSQLSGPDGRAQAERLAARSVNLVMVLLGPVVILVLGGARDGLSLWLGPEYATNSTLALQILAVGVLANAIAHVPFGLLQSVGRPDLPAWFHLIELPLHFAAAWFLVSRYGIAGAALAWTVRAFLDAAFLFLAAARIHVLGARSLFDGSLRITLAILTLAAAATIVGAGILDSSGSRIATATALAAVTAGLLWALAVPAGERRRITALLRPGV